jgi:hypothetical protein
MGLGVIWHQPWNVKAPAVDARARALTRQVLCVFAHCFAKTAGNDRYG